MSFRLFSARVARARNHVVDVSALSACLLRRPMRRRYLNRCSRALGAGASRPPCATPPSTTPTGRAQCSTDRLDKDLMVVLTVGCDRPKGCDQVARGHLRRFRTRRCNRASAAGSGRPALQTSSARTTACSSSSASVRTGEQQAIGSIRVQSWSGHEETISTNVEVSMTIVDVLATVSHR